MQSNLGFRVPGKIVERLVDVGERVVAGQPLMRIDENDLSLAVSAKQNDAAAARATAVQTRADEKRYADLAAKGWVTKQRYEQAKAALDSAEAQLAAAEAEAEGRAERGGIFSFSKPMPTAPWWRRSASQARSSRPGRSSYGSPMPEPARPPSRFPKRSGRPSARSRKPASMAAAKSAGRPACVNCRILADPQTRTFEARYVLEGDAAAAPLGATVTIWIADESAAEAVEVPVGAILDDGRTTGVWAVDLGTSKVSFRQVTIRRLGEETAIVSGIAPGERVAALGAHLLHDGATIRTLVAKADAPTASTSKAATHELQPLRACRPRAVGDAVLHHRDCRRRARSPSSSSAAPRIRPSP